MPVDEDADGSRLVERLRARSGWIVGIVALGAWCAMLWLMFGDVL